MSSIYKLVPVIRYSGKSTVFNFTKSQALSSEHHVKEYKILTKDN